MDQLSIAETIKYKKILPLFYNDNEEVCKEIVLLFYQAGIRCIEFTHRGKNALTNFKNLLKYRDEFMPDLYLGIGTIQNEHDANSYIEIGTDFLISPFFDQHIADIAFHHKKLWIPGCMTPSEIHHAQKMDFNLIKLFPGNVLGPNYVSAIKPIFPTIDFIVTGGVDITEQNLKDWFNAGVVCVGLGSKLITEKDLKNNDYAQIKSITIDVLKIISSLNITNG